jgi:hypothetical protein
MAGYLATITPEVLQKVSVVERGMRLCKSYSKKKRKKELKRNGHKSVRGIENNGYLDARLKKRKRR